MGGKELAEKWQGALPAARRRFAQNVAGEEAMTEERPAYVAGVPWSELLDRIVSEGEAMVRGVRQIQYQEAVLDGKCRELLETYDTRRLCAELRTTAGRLVEVRHAVLQAQQAYKQAQGDYAEAELAHKLSWRESNEAQQPDPTTGKINQAWVGLREEAAVLRAAHLGKMRVAVADLEREWRATQAEFEGLQDVFAALRHVARLTSAELAYLAGGGA